MDERTGPGTTVMEVAATLARHGAPVVDVAIEMERDGPLTVTLTARLPDDDRGQLRVLALYDALQRLVDVATMRALCERYDIRSDDLMRYLTRLTED